MESKELYRISTVQELKEEIEREKDQQQKLKEEEINIKKELMVISSDLKALNERDGVISDKVVKLRNLTSELAKNLLEETLKEHEILTKEMKCKKEEKNELEEKINSLNNLLKKLEKSIFQKEKEPDCYINIQCSIMVSEFFEYMRKNLKEFGVKLEKNFIIKEKTKEYNSFKPYGGSTMVPTGNLGIYDVDAECFIVISRDFFFDCKLYECVGEDEIYTPICINSNWYCRYKKKFEDELLKTLQKEYNFYEFKLTMNKKKGFTLKLI